MKKNWIIQIELIDLMKWHLQNKYIFKGYNILR